MARYFRFVQERSTSIFIGIAFSLFFIALSVQAATTIGTNIQTDGTFSVTGTSPLTVTGSSPLTGDSIILYPGRGPRSGGSLGYSASPDPVQTQLRLLPTITASQSSTPVEANYNAGLFTDTTVDLSTSEPLTDINRYNRYFSGFFHAQTLSTNTKTLGEMKGLGVITNFNGSGSARHIGGISDWTIVNGTVVGQVDGIWSGVWFGHDFNTGGQRTTTYTADSGSYSTATVGTMIGFRANQNALDTSTITNLYGIYIDPPQHDAGASIVNNTGLYFAQQSAGSGTNYTIDASASTAQSAFGGKVHFNDTIDATAVGIGTASPGALLEVNKLQNADTAIRVLNESTGAAASQTVLVGNLASGGQYGYFRHFGNSYTTSGPYMASSTVVSANDLGGLNLITSNSAALMRFYTGGGADANLRMVILSNGNVGIGTAAPVSKFQVTAGASATTTVNFGEVGTASSHACFNTKNTVGTDISFYFVGTTMVVENNLCR